MKIDLSEAKRIRAILEKELPEILSKHGLTCNLGNSKYDASSLTFTKMRISFEGAASETETALVNELKYRATSDWMTELDATKIATLNNLRYSLTGFKPRNRKYPFICKNLANGKDYKFTEEAVERMFAAA